MFVEPPIVDAHAHILVAGMPFKDDAWIRPSYEYSAEDFLAELDRHGISFGVIAAASFHGDYNDYTLRSLQKHRRLRATIVLDPGTGPEKLARLAAQGVVGVRLQFKEGAALPDLRGFGWRKFLHRLADCGMHVELNGSGNQLTTLLPPLMDNGVKVVVDHLGLLRSPDGVASEGFQSLLHALDRGRVWVKLSGGFRMQPELRRAGAARLLATAGPERLFWGSDTPFVGKEAETSYATVLQMFYDMVPDAAIRRKISDAALRFYFF